MQVLSFLLHVDPYLQLLVTLFNLRYFSQGCAAHRGFFAPVLSATWKRKYRSTVLGCERSHCHQASLQKISEAFGELSLITRAFMGEAALWPMNCIAQKTYKKMSQNIILFINQTSPGLLVFLPAISSKCTLLSQDLRSDILGNLI